MGKTIFIAIAVSVLTMTAAGLSYCEQEYSEEDLRVFDGKVVAVNLDQSSLTVKGSTQITFPVSLDTKLMKYGENMKLSDFDTEDYVTVEYYPAGDQARVPAKVAKITVEYENNVKDPSSW